jgi:hypothetical protein
MSADPLVVVREARSSQPDGPAFSMHGVQDLCHETAFSARIYPKSSLLVSGEHS